MDILVAVITLIGILLAFGFLTMLIMEAFNTVSNLRGRNLNKALVKILAPGEGNSQVSKDGLYQKFIDSPMYKQLSSSKTFIRSSHPQYLEFESFWTILKHILYNKEKSSRKLAVPPGSVEGYLGQLLQEYPYDLDDPEVETELKAKVQYLFDSAMDRAFSESKGSIISYLFLIGFLIAFSINVDVFQMFKSFMLPPDSAEQISLLGWERPSIELTVFDWLIKTFGWLISAIVMAFSASFLFQVLNKIANIRSAHRSAPSPEIIIQTESKAKANEGFRSDTNLSFDSRQTERDIFQPTENIALNLDLTSKEALLAHLPVLKKLVSQGQLELAMQTALKTSGFIPEDSQNELFALSGRYKVLLNNKNQNLISTEDFRINESRISHAFLRFVDRLKEVLS